MVSKAIIKNPSDLVQWSRFDLPFKSLFAQSYLRGLETEFYEEMYKHHLRVWNNFQEHDNPEKRGYQAFRDGFIDLIESLGEKGFDSNQSLVPLSDQNHILNGAHRVAACIAHDIPVHCRQGTDRIDGQFDCSWSFFSQHQKFGQLDLEFADRAAIEITRFRPEARLVTIFPSAIRQGRLDDVVELIREHGNLIYERPVAILKKGAVNFMRELYYKEPWAEKNSGAGYRAKANFCYPSGWFKKNLPTQVYLVEIENLETAMLLKQKIRDLYNLGKHSVHINDTHDESLRLSKCLFNGNSRLFLNHFNGLFFPQFEGLLVDYQNWITDKQLDPDDYCISAGSVLSAFGLKECKDIDYLHMNPVEHSGNPLIQSHNNYGRGRYHLHRDDIVSNPRNHFYRYGIKFSSIDVVRRLKEKRGEPKDFRDIALLNTLKL